MTATAELVHVPRWKLPEFGLRLRNMPARCGRPRPRVRHACKAKPMWGITACWHHASDAERLLSKDLEQRYGHGEVQRPPLDAAWRTSPYPACWSWPVSAEIRELAVVGEPMMFDWQACRCAVCGCSKARLFEDHDHDTGWVRGWLCQSCNLREPGAVPGHPHPVDRRLVRYRRWNPARILGLWERYHSPFRGRDFGRLGGYQTTRPHPVDSNAVVLIEDYLYDLWSHNSPIDRLSRDYERAVRDLDSAPPAVS